VHGDDRLQRLIDVIADVTNDDDNDDDDASLLYLANIFPPKPLRPACATVIAATSPNGRRDRSTAIQLSLSVSLSRLSDDEPSSCPSPAF